MGLLTLLAFFPCVGFAICRHLFPIKVSVFCRFFVSWFVSRFAGSVTGAVRTGLLSLRLTPGFFATEKS